MSQINKLNSSNCRLCNASSLLLLKRYSTNFNESNKINTYDFACSSISNTNIQPSLYRCINCGLTQIPINESPNNFIDLYKDVVDKKYIGNLNIKYKKLLMKLLNPLKQV